MVFRRALEPLKGSTVVYDIKVTEDRLRLLDELNSAINPSTLLKLRSGATTKLLSRRGLDCLWRENLCLSSDIPRLVYNALPPHVSPMPIFVFCSERSVPLPVKDRPACCAGH